MFKILSFSSGKIILTIIAIYMQKLQSWQLVDRHSALTSLEQSRLFLIKQATQYQGRPLDVVRELNACFGNDNRAAFDRNVEELTVKKNGVQSRRRRLSSFLICCIRFLFNPWKWQSAVGIAIKLILISASLSTTIQFYHARHQSCNSQRKIVSTIMYSKEAENIDSLLTISKSPLDVFCGRGWFVHHNIWNHNSISSENVSPSSSLSLYHMHACHPLDMVNSRNIMEIHDGIGKCFLAVFILQIQVVGLSFLTMEIHIQCSTKVIYGTTTFHVCIGPFLFIVVNESFAALG